MPPIETVEVPDRRPGIPRRLGALEEYEVRGTDGPRLNQRVEAGEPLPVLRPKRSTGTSLTLPVWIKVLFAPSDLRSEAANRDPLR